MPPDRLAVVPIRNVHCFLTGAAVVAAVAWFNVIHPLSRTQLQG
jgi:hypothetical protein